MPLRIGFSSCYFHADSTRAIFKGKTLLYLEQSLTHWIGAEKVLLYMIAPPAPGGLKAEAIAEDLDALVLQGGSDVSPATYGETPLKPEWKGDAIRDAYEIDLFQNFVARKKPVLGVCRGAQLINVAMGGTLYQDIETQFAGAQNHRDWNIYDKNFHEIKFPPGSQLAHLYPGIQTAKVNTIHHQALRKLGSGLRVEAVSVGDEIIESIRGTGDSYLFAVQWHPEFHDTTDTSLLNGDPIRQEFLREAQRRSAC